MYNLISKQLLGISIAAALIFTTTGCGSSSTTTKISRQALHCKDIYFIHPVTNEKMHFSTEFPNDMKGVI